MPEVQKVVKRLTQAEVACVLQLAGENLPQAEIAQRFGVTQQAISKILRQFSSSEQLAKLFMRGSALTLAKSAVMGSIRASRRGEAKDALELLDRLDVAPKRAVEAGAAVQINIGQLGQPIGARPIIDLGPSPTAELPPAISMPTDDASD